MSKERIDVFISSTSIDLPIYREAVRDAILTLGFVPNGMEHWPVTGENPVELCKRMVEDSEIYIGIFAHRFGWKPDGYGGKSITELEYDWAAQVRYRGEAIPRLCFIMKDEHPWPKTSMEIEAEADLKRFKQRVKENHVGFFTTPDNLKAQVLAALSVVKEKWLRHDDSFQWAAGHVLQDRYVLRETIGSGGNGDVWRADEVLPDDSTRPVAIKVLRAGISGDPVRVMRFRNEISIMARIKHDHIVPIYTYGERDKQQYVVMPFMAGGTFRDKLTGKPLPLDEAMRWLEQIGAALDHVHDRHSGVIHRDVKPENMLLDAADSRLYLSDFGLVFSTDRTDDDDRLTDDGKPAGTGRYMAPEQWQGEALSRQTDLYALGVLAYELLTGHLPYQEPNDFLLAKAHCERDLPSDAALPDEILRILQRATAKSAADRYPTARALLTDLRNWDQDPANAEPRIRDYLKWLTDEAYERLREVFIDLAGDTHTVAAYDLPTNKTTLPAWEDDEDDLFGRIGTTVHADHIPANRDADHQPQQFVENVRQRLLELDRAVLVGEPGSGKSWMLRRLQADYARFWLKGSANGRGLVPILVRLNEYTGGPFIDFVKSEMDMLAPYHDSLLQHGGLVLLCDALNEMPRNDEQLDSLLDYLQNVATFVVSCRVRDYRDDLGALKPLEQVVLHDLELPAIQELVYKRLPGEPGQQLWRDMGGTPNLMTLWQQANDNDEGDSFWEPATRWSYDYDWDGRRDWERMHTVGARLIPLARNPYMADLLCKTYRQSEAGLPDSRAALFGQFIGQMLSREAKAAVRRGDVFPDPASIEAALITLARALQASARTTISPDAAQQALSDAEAYPAISPQPDQPTPAALLAAATDAHILSNDGDVLRFSHQLLQEYYAARILLEDMLADEHEHTHQRAIERMGADWWDAGVWRETTIILGEFLGDAAQGPNRVARWLSVASPEVSLQVITRNAAGLTLDDVEDSTRELLIDSALKKRDEVDALGRAAAYRVLGLFDADQRRGVGLTADGLPDMDWVEIPAGKFIYQDDQELELDTFYISRYLLTYRQFQAFIDAPDGCADLRWFEGLAADESDRQMREQYFKYANHPREMVNWYQAVAFCRWLSYRLTGVEPDLDAVLSWPVRLPTEQEWEKAARGPNGLRYPYGNDFDAAKGNTRESGIGLTSAVGMYPGGASPYGVLDMSGNVWEWCLTSWEDGDNQNMRSSASRVLRGGSFYNSRDFARCGHRDHYLPSNSYDGYGIRFVVACPPS